MSRKIANGVQITQQCWKALKQNPQLMMFPLLSGIAVFLVSVLFFVPTVGVLWAAGGGEIPTKGDLSSAEWIVLTIIGFIYYFVCYTVIIFSNTALVGTSLKLLKGQSATVADGINIAMSRIGQIIGFALISATIGTIARSISNSGRNSDNGILGLVTMLLGGLIQGVWSVVVFFAIPVFVVENVGPITAIQRSWIIFKKTWGEGFTGRAVIGGVGCLVQFILIAILVGLFALAVAAKSILIGVLAVLLGVVAFSAITLLTGAINGIFQASLYQYATTGNAGRFIDNSLARNAFPSLT